MNGREEYFTRDDPVQQERLDNRYGFSPTTNSCKTAAIINSYIADGNERISFDQIDQAIRTDKGTLSPNIDTDGSPLDGNAFSQSVARSMGLRFYNSIGQVEGASDAVQREISFMRNATGHPHFVYRDGNGMMDSLDPSRPAAATYQEINQQRITTKYLCIWLKRSNYGK